MLHIAIGGAGPLQTAPPLMDDAVNMSLAQRFRRRLIDTPRWFLEGIAIRDYPLVRVEWVSLCATAGLVILRAAEAEPEVFCLLLSGVESEEELASVRVHAPMFEPLWQKVEAMAPGSRAVSLYRTPSWAANPSVTTILGALANAFFAQFGVSE